MCLWKAALTGGEATFTSLAACDKKTEAICTNIKESVRV